MWEVKQERPGRDPASFISMPGGKGGGVLGGRVGAGLGAGPGLGHGHWVPSVRVGWGRGQGWDAGTRAGLRARAARGGVASRAIAHMVPAVL